MRVPQRTGRVADSPPALVATVLAMLYVFLVGIGLIEAGIASFGAGFQDLVIAQVANPLSALFAGLLATVLVQSSSVSTSTIVALVGAGTLPLELAVPMVMGANIGTTVTSTLAALGSLRRGGEFQRAFAGATMHDFFNLLAVAVLFPIEVASGFLTRSAAALADRFRDFNPRDPSFDSPIRTAVRRPVEAIEAMLDGRVTVGVVGTVSLALGLTLILVALKLITSRMRRLVAGTFERAMNRAISRGGGLIGLLVGVIVTVAVQSSSITTSILVPMVAAGVLTLPNAFPITLGANIGTTVTALLASLAVVHPGGLTIALVHTLFNLVGVALVYPIPAVRRVPIRLADGLAVLAVKHHAIIIVYVAGLFLVIPLVALIVL